ncbi:MAG: hypothetical protein IPI77_18075 [Saprospiraceae bacterium]|nr:hypothetical protein [Saprospiraceae bacterium]
MEKLLSKMRWSKYGIAMKIKCMTMPLMNTGIVVAKKQKKQGTYKFTTIVPVSYKANPDNEASWRPAHIHMRVSVPNQQDLITQIYFKGDKYVETDKWAASPQAVNRILDISKINPAKARLSLM